MTESLALAFAIGLLVGSFVNVLIHRLPLMISAQMHPVAQTHRFDLCWPASHCTHCLTPLKFWHNIPLLSFVWLKGRCGFCAHPIGRLYPCIEFITAFIWLLCAWRWGFNVTGLCWAFFVTTLLAASVIDWQTTLLPDALTQSLVWIGLIASAMGWIAVMPQQSIWGAVAGYASLWSVATIFERLTNKQGMGAGDFKLLAGLGAWLGPLALIPLVLMASLAGVLIGLLLKFTGKLGEEGYIPFGPFLAGSGVLIAALGMAPIAAWMGWSFFP
jgi:leader peptidase (prepilin peptidase)/N-methyltransferase